VWSVPSLCNSDQWNNDSPRVEAGYSISTVIPASRKRRWKEKPVVLDETVMYGYESSATLTTDRLQTEGAARQRANQFSGKRKEKVKSNLGPQRGAQYQDILTDVTVNRKVTSTLDE
jgi:hypothetical protein